MANKYPPTTRRLFLPSSDAKYVPRAAGSPLSDAMRKCFPSGRNLGLTNTLLGSFARTGSGLRTGARINLFIPPDNYKGGNVISSGKGNLRGTMFRKSPFGREATGTDGK